MKRILFYTKQYIHNTFSILTASVAILAMAGWIESGHYFRSAAAMLYFIVWVLAQYVPGSDGRRHNTTLIR